MSAVLDDNIGFDEPAQPSATTDRNAVAVSNNMIRVQSALGEFDRVAAGLAEIEARYPKDAVYEVTTTKGMKDAVEHRAAWRDPRITVEKARKMAKAPLLALGKSIDARAAWITEKLREGEEPIDLLIRVEETRREEEKQARINAEAGRVLGIQEALAEIAADVLIACGKTSADIRALQQRMQSTQPDPLVFQEMIDQAKAAWSSGIAKLETAYKAKLWEEAEAKRAAEERAADAARRAEEEARLARVAAEQKEAADKLAAERAEFERQRAEFLAQQRATAPAPVESPAPAAKLEADTTLQQVPAADVPALSAALAVTPGEARLSVPLENPAPEVDEGATLKLGEINALIAPFSTTAEGMKQCGIEPAGRERTAVLYRRADLQRLSAFGVTVFNRLG